MSTNGRQPETVDDRADVAVSATVMASEHEQLIAAAAAAAAAASGGGVGGSVADFLGGPMSYLIRSVNSSPVIRIIVPGN